jgi:hypothetical protein
MAPGMIYAPGHRVSLQRRIFFVFAEPCSTLHAVQTGCVIRFRTSPEQKKSVPVVLISRAAGLFYPPQESLQVHYRDLGTVICMVPDNTIRHCFASLYYRHGALPVPDQPGAKKKCAGGTDITGCWSCLSPAGIIAGSLSGAGYRDLHCT